jgi:hypothetical protein
MLFGYGSRVGLPIVLIQGLLGVHSRYGLHTALLPIRDTPSEGFSYFVTSIAAPVASGWSGCRGGAPIGKRRLSTAHHGAYVEAEQRLQDKCVMARAVAASNPIASLQSPPSTKPPAATLSLVAGSGPRPSAKARSSMRRPCNILGRPMFVQCSEARNKFGSPGRSAW